jgi:hypothetical protein
MENTCSPRHPLCRLLFWGARQTKNHVLAWDKVQKKQRRAAAQLQKKQRQAWVKKLRRAKRKTHRTFEGATFKVTKASVRGDWPTDRYYGYSSSWSVRKARKTNRYVVIDVVVSSKGNPGLPRILAYTKTGDRLTYVGVADVAFYSWSSHACSIGLHHDPKNDFAYTDSVKFTYGIQVSREAAKGPIFLVYEANGSMVRRVPRHDPPNYNQMECEGACEGLPATLPMDDTFIDRVVTVINIKKLR